MDINGLLELLVELSSVGSYQKRHKRNLLFNTIIAPFLIVVAVFFLLVEWEYLLMLSSPIYFYLIFLPVGLVLTMLMTILFSALRILTFIEKSTMSVLLITSLCISFSTGSYLNRIVKTDLKNNETVETRWFS